MGDAEFAAEDGTTLRAISAFEAIFWNVGARARPYMGNSFSAEGGVDDSMLGRFIIVASLWVVGTLFMQWRFPMKGVRSSASSDLFTDKDPDGDGPLVKRGADAGVSSSMAPRNPSASGVVRRRGKLQEEADVAAAAATAKDVQRTTGGASEDKSD
jgi:hypothetical protein